jgi:hypothetical protein
MPALDIAEHLLGRRVERVLVQHTVHHGKRMGEKNGSMSARSSDGPVTKAQTWK